MYNKYLFFFILFILLGIYIFFKGLKLFSNNFNNLNLKKHLYFLNNLHPIAIICIGILSSALIQSTAICISLTIPLINNNTINIKNGLYLVAGFNVGTVSSLLISGNHMFYWIVILAILSFYFILFSRSNKKFIYMYKLTIGILLVYLGLFILKLSFKNIINTSLFNFILTELKSNTKSFIYGIILSAIIQSGSIINNTFQELYILSSVSLDSILLIIIGSNIGSTLIGLFVSLKYNVEAKLVAYFHILLNTIGSLLFLILFNTTKSILINLTSIKHLHVSIFHLMFNISSAVIIIPFIRFYIKKGTYSAF